jgi:diguanylate cyclase (GGDEF)-like protein
MSRRLLATLTGVTLVILLTGALLVGFQLQDMLATLRQDRVNGITRSFGRELSAHLDEAQTYVRALTTTATSAEGLRQQLLRSPMIAGVAVLSADAVARRPADASLPALSAEDFVVLASGQTLLATRRDGHGVQRVYLIRQLGPSQSASVAFFELAERWLWQQSVDSARLKVSVDVLDDGGQLLSGTRVLPAAVIHDLLGLAIPLGREDLTMGPMYDWRDAGAAMQAVAVRIEPQALRLRGEAAWTVVGSMSPAAFSLLPLLESALPWLLLAAALIPAIGTLYLRRRLEPPLQQILDALEEWRRGRFVSVRARAGSDLPDRLAQSFNRTAPILALRQEALTTLRQIDRLLLEAVEIEQCLEPVLVKISTLIGAEGATVVLVDPNAPGHGRVFTASRVGSISPMRRIGLDVATLEAFSDETTGMNIRRGASEHHALFESLRDLDGDFYRIWRVMAQGRLVAVLAASYHGQAIADAAAHGAECAAMLAVALSNSVRDEQLYRQAHFDSLTSLPNRLLFRDRLSQEIAVSTDGSRRGALLYVDLDHFKKINDSAGHVGGDQLLTVVAQRLRACVKDGDTVARMGGDEFTVILRDVGRPEAAREIAERIIEALQRPVYIAGRDYRVLASIGIAVFPDDGSSIDDLMRHADLAMYQAKEGGRSQAVLFNSAMALPPSGIAASGLFRALRQGEFVLFYQPVFALHDGDLLGVEALLRWQPPQEEMRLPQDFVPAAEESGAIVEIGGWALEGACAQFAAWMAQDIAPSRLFVNVSVQQLRAPELAAQLAGILERHGIDAARLELELTEAACAEDDARATLRQLAELGVRLSLDNFGTGYSSLNHLRQLPLQAVKLDRSFVADAVAGPASALARTVIEMAHALGKQVIAEGAETLEQVDALREQGCDAAQGFGLAPPSSAAAMTELLRERARSEALPDRRKTG